MAVSKDPGHALLASTTPLSLSTLQPRAPGTGIGYFADSCHSKDFVSSVEGIDVKGDTKASDRACYRAPCIVPSWPGTARPDYQDALGFIARSNWQMQPASTEALVRLGQPWQSSNICVTRSSTSPHVTPTSRTSPIHCLQPTYHACRSALDKMRAQVTMNNAI
jgi:hypothetical protein